MMKTTNFHWSALGLFLLAGCGAPASQSASTTPESTSRSSGASKTSGYDNMTAIDLNGQAVSFEKYRDRPVVVFSFFATWCKPCMKELVQLDKLYQARQSDGLMVVAVSVDDSETQGQVGPMMRARGYTFPTWIDRMDKVSGMLNPEKTVPFTAIFDHGEIVFKHEGYVPGDEELLAEAIGDALSGE